MQRFTPKSDHFFAPVAARRSRAKTTATVTKRKTAGDRHAAAGQGSYLDGRLEQHVTTLEWKIGVFDIFSPSYQNVLTFVATDSHLSSCVHVFMLAFSRMVIGFTLGIYFTSGAGIQDLASAASTLVSHFSFPFLMAIPSCFDSSAQCSHAAAVPPPSRFSQIMYWHETVLAGLFHISALHLNDIYVYLSAYS
jgi:hypothetical protein